MYNNVISQFIHKVVTLTVKDTKAGRKTQTSF